MRWAIFAGAVDATLTGLFLLASPSLFAWLILGAELSEPGAILGRVAGVSMFALGVASFPVSGASAARGLATFNLIATIYLAFLGLGGKFVGLLLWPAAAFHLILTTVISLIWLTEDRRK